MNDFLVDEIFKNTQKVRIKNQVQEKLLKELIDGHKGYREKLNKSLSKIEKTRQIIEQEYYYMEKEMRELGLTPRRYDKNKPYNNTSVKMSNKNTKEIVIKSDEEEEDESELISKKALLPKRRNSFAGAQTRFDQKLPRKFSLDSSNIEPKKNLSPVLLNQDLEDEVIMEEMEQVEFEKRPESINNIETRSIFSALFSPIKTEQETSNTLKSARINTARTSFSNLSSMTSNSLRKANLMSNSNYNFPKLKRNSSSSRPNSKKKEEQNSKRQVSFGQVELTQLEIPTVYKYSNIGYEKFKLNPHFYLPDGSLKRKFSLPKLEESMEAVKNCRYLRRNSKELQEAEINLFNDFDNSSQSSSIDKNIL